MPFLFNVTLDFSPFVQPTWKVRAISILPKSAAGYEGFVMSFPKPQLDMVVNSIQQKIEKSDENCFFLIQDILFDLSSKYQINVLNSQANHLSQSRWAGNMKVIETTDDLLFIKFWIENQNPLFLKISKNNRSLQFKSKQDSFFEKTAWDLTEKHSVISRYGLNISVYVGGVAAENEMDGLKLALVIVANEGS